MNMNSGYHGWSRSNRAAVAEKDGKLPLARFCQKYGYNAAKVKEHLDPCEWHHASKFANRTDYYSPVEALLVRRKITTRRPTPGQLEARKAHMAAAIEDVWDRIELARIKRSPATAHTRTVRRAPCMA